MLWILLAAALSVAAPTCGGDVVSFDCSKAPELFGHPEAEVVTCKAFYGSPRLWFVWLKNPEGAVKRFALVGEGEPFIGQGLAAAGRFLEEGSLNTNRKLVEKGALLFINVADVRPPGWTEREGIGEFPGIGRSDFRTNPFRLTLIRAVLPRGRGLDPRRDGPGPGGYSPPVVDLYQQAVLSRNAVGVWEWEISNWVDGEWEQQSTIELR